jgi:hypothetical protein
MHASIVAGVGAVTRGASANAVAGEMRMTEAAATAAPARAAINFAMALLLMAQLPNGL